MGVIVIVLQAVVAVRDAARDDAIVALKETREAPGALRREFALLARLRSTQALRRSQLSDEEVTALVAFIRDLGK